MLLAARMRRQFVSKLSACDDGQCTTLPPTVACHNQDSPAEGEPKRLGEARRVNRPIEVACWPAPHLDTLDCVASHAEESNFVSRAIGNCDQVAAVSIDGGSNAVRLLKGVLQRAHGGPCRGQVSRRAALLADSEGEASDGGPVCCIEHALQSDEARRCEQAVHDAPC
eukprot:1838113-Prymnesium_polylepis.1